MSISILELQRAHKLLSDFCARRSGQGGGSCPQLTCELNESTLILMQHGAVPRALVRLVYDHHQWNLYWPRDDGSWQVYPHLPAAENIRAVIEQLEQAPLHVHW